MVSVQQDTDKLDITLIVFFVQPGDEESDGEEEGWKVKIKNQGWKSKT